MSEEVGDFAAGGHDVIGANAGPAFRSKDMCVMLVATQRSEPFPAGAEERLAAFTDLVATAVGNAQAHEGLRRFGEEQATLRRIATLVARGVEPEQVFAAVTEETAATFHAITTVIRFEHDPPGIVVVGVSKETGIPIGRGGHSQKG
jgi:hypothetical protein